MKHNKSKAPRGGPSTNCPSQTAMSGEKQTRDCEFPNPKGRSTQDGKRARGNMLNCKKYSNIATLNTRTIRLENKQIELANRCREHSIAIMGIVDHKIVHSDEDLNEIVYKEVEDRLLITSSAWRTESNAASGGVGLMISKSAADNLAEVRIWNERIIIANFNGNPALTIIVNYSPVEGKEEADEHYNQLTAAIKEVPKHNVLFVVGDFNAHIDKKTAKYSFHDKTNKNGQLLTDMTEETGLYITNANFQKKAGKIWTFISDMSGTKTQVDYILVNRKWKNSVHNCEAFNSMSSLGSDHRVVCAKVKISLRRSKAPSVNNYDWAALKCEELQQLYSVKINNRYRSLCSEEDSPTESYAHLIKANDECAQELILKKKKKKKQTRSEDPRIEAARKKTEKAAHDYNINPSNFNREELQSCKKALAETYELIEEEELDAMIKEAESADRRSQHRESWSLINKITGRKAAKQGIIKARNKEERLKKWYDHFYQLLGNQPTVEGELDPDLRPVLHDLDISDEPFSAEEYQAVRKSLVEGKGYGPDRLPPAVFKYCDMEEIMLKYANGLLQGSKPDQWSESDMIPIPKSGDLTKTDNYRGIALSCVAAKITNKLILNRIRPKIDLHLRPNQNGFRPLRSTIAHILALRRLMEGVRSNNLKCIVTFVDFKKAFDTVHRGRMLQILKNQKN